MDTFENSDSARSGKALRELHVTLLAGSFPLRLGGVLENVEVAWESYGELNSRKDNAILICHAISGDSHVTRHSDEDDPGWWEELVGPGKAIDT
ncbi:homoserine O-acetyltransferase, partial [Myxococcota bacterium]|nr:homoserine O-acetyltransferase [Myxococcota bacterium]